MTRLETADVMTEAPVTVVADGVNVTGPPVAETVIVIPGKSARPVKVLELEVTVWEGAVLGVGDRCGIGSFLNDRGDSGTGTGKHQQQHHSRHTRWPPKRHYWQ